MAVAGLPTLPPVFRRLVRIVGLGRLKPDMLEKLDAWAMELSCWAGL